MKHEDREQSDNPCFESLTPLHFPRHKAKSRTRGFTLALTMSEVCCLWHLSWQVGTLCFSIASVTILSIPTTARKEMFPCIKIKRMQTNKWNQACCSIWDSWDYHSFWGKPTVLEICCLQRLDIIYFFAFQPQKTGIWITANLHSVVLQYCWHSTKYSSRWLQQFTEISVLTSTGTSDILYRSSQTLEQARMWCTEVRQGPREGFSPAVVVISPEKSEISSLPDSETSLQTHSHVILTNFKWRLASEFQEEF